MITVLLVDDHVSFQNNLQYMLETTADIEVMATAGNGIEAVAQMREQCVDVAVVDISMPLMDGIETARQIQEICPQTRVMILSILNQPEYIQRALDVGVQGFVLKDAIGTDLLPGVRALASGKSYFSRTIAQIAERYIRRLDANSLTG
jgi:two-component system nitrate/nitrite response regulator NarL